MGASVEDAAEDNDAEKGAGEEDSGSCQMILVDETLLCLVGIKEGDSTLRFFLFPSNISLSCSRTFGKNRGEFVEGELRDKSKIDSFCDE